MKYAMSLSDCRSLGEQSAVNGLTWSQVVEILAEAGFSAASLTAARVLDSYATQLKMG